MDAHAADALVLQGLAQGVCDGNAAVPAAGAADGHHQVHLPLLHIVGDEKVQELCEHVHEGPGLGIAEHEVRNRLVQPREGPEIFHIKGIGQEAHVEDQVRVHRDAVLVAEGHGRDLQLPLLSRPRKEAEHAALQLAQGELGAVEHHVRPGLDGSQQLLLPGHSLLQGDALSRQRVRPAGFLVAPHQGAQVRVHIEDAHGAALHGLQLIQGAEELPEAVPLPHVGDQGHLVIAAVGIQAELGKARHQRNGHIVHAIVIQILQHVRRPALARAGKTGNDEKFHNSLRS